MIHGLSGGTQILCFFTRAFGGRTFFSGLKFFLKDMFVYARLFENDLSSLKIRAINEED